MHTYRNALQRCLWLKLSRLRFKPLSLSIIKSKKWPVILLLAFLLLISMASRYMLETHVLTNFEPYFLNSTFSESISCHFMTEADALPAAEGLSPPVHSIFFHETSCLGGLDSRQACAVESAARMHPERSIYVLFNSPVTETVLDRSCLAKLMQFGNVQLARVHIAEYAQQTALAGLLGQVRNNQSQWNVEHTSDLLRFITLYKYGGVYLDTDMLVVKPLDRLGTDWVAREDGTSVNGAALSVGKSGIGHHLVMSILDDLEWNFNPNGWRNNGPEALNRVVLALCGASTNITVTNTSDFTCQGFTVYSPSVFYPIHYYNASVYFKPGDLPEETLTAHAHHLWNRLTKNLTVENNSPYDKLSRVYCPTVRQMYGDRFGS